MVYKIFLFMFEGVAHPWLAFAGATIVSLYAIYLALLLAGAIWSYSVYFVYEGKVTVPNFVLKFIRKGYPATKLVNGKLHGWYRSDHLGMNTYWKYRHYRDGYHIDSSDSDRWKAEALANTSGGLPIFSHINSVALYIFLPLVLAILFLFADTFPIVSAGIVMYYGILLTARKAVGLAESFKNHLNDPNAHKEENEKEKAE